MYTEFESLQTQCNSNHFRFSTTRKTPTSLRTVTSPRPPTLNRGAATDNLLSSRNTTSRSVQLVSFPLSLRPVCSHAQKSESNSSVLNVSLIICSCNVQTLSIWQVSIHLCFGISELARLNTMARALSQRRTRSDRPGTIPTPAQQTRHPGKQTEEINQTEGEDFEIVKTRHQTQQSKNEGMVASLQCVSQRFSQHWRLEKGIMALSHLAIWIVLWVTKFCEQEQKNK